MGLFSLSLWEDSYPEALGVYLHKNHAKYHHWEQKMLVVILCEQATDAVLLSNSVISPSRFGSNNRAVNVATTTNVFGWEALKCVKCMDSIKSCAATVEKLIFKFGELFTCSFCKSCQKLMSITSVCIVYWQQITFCNIENAAPLSTSSLKCNLNGRQSCTYRWKANLTLSAIFPQLLMSTWMPYSEREEEREALVKCLIRGKWLQCQTSPSCHGAAIIRISIRSSCHGWNHILIPTTLLLWWGRSALRHI